MTTFPPLFESATASLTRSRVNIRFSTWTGCLANSSIISSASLVLQYNDPALLTFPERLPLMERFLKMRSRGLISQLCEGCYQSPFARTVPPRRSLRFHVSVLFYMRNRKLPELLAERSWPRSLDLLRCGWEV